MRSSTSMLSLRTLATAGALAAAPAALAQLVDAHAIGDVSKALPQDDPLGGPKGAYPRIVGIGPVDDGWITAVGGLNEIEIHFDRAVDLPLNALRAYETPGAEIMGLQLSSNTDNTVYTVGFAPPGVSLGRVRVVLDSRHITAAGLPLDGEIADPASPVFPSGDGRAGGQAVFLFNVLAGDANRDGVVDGDDADAIVQALGTAQGDPGYNPLADFNRDGFVNVLDVAAWSMGNGDALPVTDGTPPTAELVSPDPNQPIPPGVDTLVFEFSESVAGEGLTPGTLALVDAFGSLSGVDALNIVSPTRVEFTLDAPLVADLAYSATLSNAVADLSGELLPLKKMNVLFPSPGNVSIFPPRTFPTGFGPEFAAQGDLNNDDRTDFAVSNAVDGTISVLLGNGDGTFMPQIVSFAGDTPRGLALGDYDDDGNLDAAVALEGEGAVAVLYGDGAGNLGAGPNGATFAVTGASPVFVASGLLDNDSIPDLAVVNSGAESVSILLPRDDRTLGIAPLVVVPGMPSAAAIGELTGDDLLDLAVTDEAGDTLSVFRGLGNGEFVAPTRGAETLPTGVDPVFVGIGDLDNDKDLDLYTANKGGSTTIFSNTAFSVRGGGFTAQEVGVGDGAVYVGIGDLDNDKDLDLATADRDSDSVTPVKQGPAGIYASDPALDSGDEPVFVAITDLNDDGDADVVTVLSRDGVDRRGALVVRLGGSDSGIEGQRQFPAPESPTNLVIAGISGTNALDIIVAGDGVTPEVQVLEGVGDGDFTPGSGVFLSDRPQDLIVANLLEEPARDIAVAVGGESNRVDVYSNTDKGFFLSATIPNATRVARGNLLPGVDGMELVTAPLAFTSDPVIGVYNLFATPRGGPVPLATADVDGGIVSDIVVADFNGDTLLDIGAVGYNGVFGEIIVERGTANAGFVVFFAQSFEGSIFFDDVVRVDLPDDLSFLELDAADVNGDLLPDVIIAANTFISARGSANTGSFTLLASDEQTVFAEPVQTIVGERVGGVVAKDFTNDGRADVAVSSVLDDEVAVYVSAQGGGFFEPQFYETHVAPGDVHAADVNDDGAMDLAIANEGSDDITLLLGQGGATDDPINELSVSIGSLTAVAGPTTRGTVPGFDENFTGVLGVALESSPTPDVRDVLIDGAPQAFNPAALDFVVAGIVFEDGQVVGGVDTGNGNGSDSGFLGAGGVYATMVGASGAIQADGTSGRYIITADTLGGVLLSQRVFGVETGDWAEEADLVGSLEIVFTPDSLGVDESATMTFVIREPDRSR